MRVTLVQCPAFGIDRPPLALAYLSAFLKAKGHEINIFDLNIQLYNKIGSEYRKYWKFEYILDWVNGSVFLKEKFLPNDFYRNWARSIINSGSEVIGFSVQSSSLEASLNLAKEIKKLAGNKRIIFGGPIHLCYKDINEKTTSKFIINLLNITIDNNSVIDIMVIGEGEETLVEILDRLEGNEGLEDCKGIVFKENGKITGNPPRPLIKELDEIPFPDFSGFSQWNRDRSPILGSRGCIHKCLFCDDTLMWRHFRLRSAENILEEFKLQKSQGVKFLEFNDLLINGNLNQLSELCNLLIKEKLGLGWGGSACINSGMDLDFLKKMKQAGCCYLNYGVESGSQKILDEMRKGYTLKDIEKVIQNTCHAGITVCTNWIVGFPAETYKDFIETLRFIEKNSKYLKEGMMVNTFMLKSYSLLFQNREKYGIIPNQFLDWHTFDGNNTEQERRKRHEEFIKFVSELNHEVVHKSFHSEG